MCFLTSAYAGGNYIYFKYNGVEFNAFSLVPLNVKHMERLTEESKLCEEIKISFSYSSINYIKSIFGSSEYPNIFSHNKSINNLKNTEIGSTVRFLFMGSYPYEAKDCNLYSTSLTSQKNEYMPIVRSIP